MNKIGFDNDKYLKLQSQVQLSAEFTDSVPDVLGLQLQ